MLIPIILYRYNKDLHFNGFINFSGVSRKIFRCNYACDTIITYVLLLSLWFKLNNIIYLLFSNLYL